MKGNIRWLLKRGHNRPMKSFQLWKRFSEERKLFRLLNTAPSSWTRTNWFYPCWWTQYWHTYLVRYKLISSRHSTNKVPTDHKSSSLQRSQSSLIKYYLHLIPWPLKKLLKQRHPLYLRGDDQPILKVIIEFPLEKVMTQHQLLRTMMMIAHGRLLK